MNSELTSVDIRPPTALRNPLHAKTISAIVPSSRQTESRLAASEVERMAFDVKELMIDITKAWEGPLGCHPSKITPTLGCGYSCLPTMFVCHPSVLTTTLLVCKLGTYTCFAGSMLTCGGTIYCAGTEEPTILFQGIDHETLRAVKAQLHEALEEVEQHEKRLAETAKKPGKGK